MVCRRRLTHQPHNTHTHIHTCPTVRQRRRRRRRRFWSSKCNVNIVDVDSGPQASARRRFDLQPAVQNRTPQAPHRRVSALSVWLAADGRPTRGGRSMVFGGCGTRLVICPSADANARAVERLRGTNVKSCEPGVRCLLGAVYW